jgi:hypothetical protein
MRTSPGVATSPGATKATCSSNNSRSSSNNSRSRQQRQQKQGSVALLAACTALQGARINQQAILRHRKMHYKNSIAAGARDVAAAVNAMTLPVLRHNCTMCIRCASSSCLLGMLAPAVYQALRNDRGAMKPIQEFRPT